MPAAVAVPLIVGAMSTGATVAASRSQAGAARRAGKYQDDAARRAEAFEREQDAKNRSDQARQEAEERRRWDTEQQNLAAERAERDARQQYEDRLRYQKMVRLSQLTGGPRPDPMPNFGAGGTYAPAPAVGPLPGAPIMARPSSANAMIAAPAAPFDPFTDTPPQQFGVPLAALSRRRA